MPLKTPTTAMIFGAGLGTRMRPLTDNLPKPMVKVYGKPIIEYSLDNLRDFGIKKVIVNTHYMAKALTDYLKTYKGLEIVTVYEKILLETGGGLVNALPYLGKDPFFVINGDIIWIDGKEKSLKQLVDNWEDKRTKASLLLQPIKKAVGYHGGGDFFISDYSEVIVTDATEKPYVFTGIQILDPDLLSGKNIEPFSIVKTYKERVKKDGALDGIYGVEHKNTWLHVGTPEAISEAEKVLSVKG